MSFCKTPFEMSGEFSLLPEHLGTRDWSRASCHNNYMHLPAGLATWVTEFEPGSALNFRTSETPSTALHVGFTPLSRPVV
jgi:hypothetical protein